jgi:hypothetical protein
MISMEMASVSALGIAMTAMPIISLAILKFVI